MLAPFTRRHTARNPAARPRPFFPSRFQQLKEAARETDRGRGGVFTPQERALTLLAQPPQSRERGEICEFETIGGRVSGDLVCSVDCGPIRAIDPVTEACDASGPSQARPAATNGYGGDFPIAGPRSGCRPQAARSVLSHVPQRTNENRRVGTRTGPTGSRDIWQPRRTGRANRPQAARRPDAADRPAASQ